MDGDLDSSDALLHLRAVPPTDAESGTVPQFDVVFPALVQRQPSDPVEIHDRRAMDPAEGAAVELALEVVEAAPRDTVTSLPGAHVEVTGELDTETKTLTVKSVKRLD